MGPERLVAVKAFAGLATDDEVARQKKALLSVVSGDSDRLSTDGKVSVLQYNSPFTIPWRRRNEIAVVVDEIVRGDAAEKRDVLLDTWKSRLLATSWYDAGVRL